MNTGHDLQAAAALTGAAIGAQAALRFQLGPKNTGAVQLELSGTGTIRVQGRLTPLAPWADLTADITASGITLLTVTAPEMRVNVTANSANLNAWIMA